MQIVKLEELTSPELRRLIGGGVRTAVIPFGSLEGQGAHLPIGADALLADFIGGAVAERLGAVLAPTVRVGHAEPHMGAAGTLSVPVETLRSVAFHLADSLAMHGFRVIVLVSTHGGNTAALEQAAREASGLHHGVVVHAPRGDVGPEPGAHSGRWLTSVMLALHPSLVDLGLAEGELAEEVARATAEAGRENLERFVDSIIDIVRSR